VYEHPNIKTIHVLFAEIEVSVMSITYFCKNDNVGPYLLPK